MFYRRNLPHYQPLDGLFHVITRLAGSVPASVIEELKVEAKIREKGLAGLTSSPMKAELIAEHKSIYLEAFEAALHSGSTGPHWLSQARIAQIIADSLRYRDRRVYELIAYCIMPNHVHMIVQLGGPVERNDIPLYRILQSLKRHTSRQANLVLKRSGAFWQAESYDHLIRDWEELEDTIGYVLFNPVKAGLARTAEEWRWSYCKYGLGI